MKKVILRINNEDVALYSDTSIILKINQTIASELEIAGHTVMLLAASELTSDRLIDAANGSSAFVIMLNTSDQLPSSISGSTAWRSYRNVESIVFKNLTEETVIQEGGLLQEAVALLGEYPTVMFLNSSPINDESIYCFVGSTKLALISTSNNE